VALDSVIARAALLQYVHSTVDLGAVCSGALHPLPTSIYIVAAM